MQRIEMLAFVERVAMEAGWTVAMHNARHRSIVGMPYGCAPVAEHVISGEFGLVHIRAGQHVIESEVTLTLELVLIVIHKAFRRQGMAKAIIGALEDEARRTGRVIYVYRARSPHIAQHLFKQGYTSVAETSDDDEDGDSYWKKLR